MPEQSEKRRDLRATPSCTWHETRTVSSALQMGFNLHPWRIHTEISPSYLLILRGGTVNGLSGSKGCDLICLHFHVYLSITMGSGSFPPGCNLALLLSPPWCAGALWWRWSAGLESGLCARWDLPSCEWSVGTALVSCMCETPLYISQCLCCCSAG